MKFATAACVGLVLTSLWWDPARAQTSSSPIDEIISAVDKSKCVSVHWPQRGLAPKSYLRGTALVFARSLCQPERADVKVVSAAKGLGTDPEKTDALTWYDPEYRALKMQNDKDGVDTLRHAYVLLIGLGMRESSGRYCVGRDRSADFSTADSAEAGLYQTSWGASKRHATLAKLYERYDADRSGCWLDRFQQKTIRCSEWDAKVWGSGTGAAWQELTKACPAFATEYAAVLLRTNGGKRGEFGPLRKKAAQIRPECHAMLSDVQKLVQAKPEMCAALK
jgi:hypothetical protein